MSDQMTEDELRRALREAEQLADARALELSGLQSQLEAMRRELFSIRTMNENAVRERDEFGRALIDLRQKQAVDSPGLPEAAVTGAAYRRALEEEHQRELARMAAEVAALKASNSWRITAPVRAVTGLLRRG